MDSLGTLLAEELRRTDFGNRVYDDAQVHAYCRSQTQLVRQLLNEEQWQNTLRTLHPYRTENDIARIIGFGCAVAEFSTGFLCNENQLKQVVQLAGCCNLLVSLYDYYMDHPVKDESFSVSRTAVQRALTENDFSGLHQSIRNGTERERVICYLIQRYAEMLQELAPQQSVPLHYRKTFSKLVLLMFDAQNATAAKTALTDSHLLMRKSALPVVALAFPVWLLNIHNPPCSYFRHLLWLYRLGNFISWIDDFADFESDRSKNLPNRLLNDAEVYPFERVVQVAAMGKKIWRDRDFFNIQAVIDKKHNDLLTYFVYKWFK